MAKLKDKSEPPIKYPLAVFFKDNSLVYVDPFLRGFLPMFQFKKTGGVQ